MGYDAAVSAILAHLADQPEFARVRALASELDLDEATMGEIVGAAGAFAHDIIGPFGRTSDGDGCRLVDGRVQTAPGHEAVWKAFVDGGWTAIEGPAEFGGMGLPMAVHSACEELFNRASAAFGMLPTPMRCAAYVLHKYANDEIRTEWLPELVTGRWGAAICISEADAGSDAPRVRTQATPLGDGAWAISGEKMWISFGDHSLTERIGYMVLARTPNAPAGSAGLSLFLVPSTLNGEPNHVTIRRIEEKLGLHASPTCELGFEEAKGWLVGTLHRGLSQLFVMIIGMRLSVGSQGAGIAGAAADLAIAYAAERKQGGRPDEPPVSIDSHGDVRRMLLNSAARAEVARGLVLLASSVSDLQRLESEESAKSRAAHMLGWLLPITKNFCAEAASLCASEAIQVLGGAGYTREWPAEQYLRDARVLTIYEGTSGMQALDLLMRRVLGGDGEGYKAFLDAVRADLDVAGEGGAADRLRHIVALLERAVSTLADAAPADCNAAAYPFLQLASLATTGWIALRMTRMHGGPVQDRLASLGRHWLLIAQPMAMAEGALIDEVDDLVAEFGSLA